MSYRNVKDIDGIFWYTIQNETEWTISPSDILTRHCFIQIARFCFAIFYITLEWIKYVILFLTKTPDLLNDFKQLVSWYR